MKHRWQQVDGPWRKERVTLWRCNVCGLRRIALRLRGENGPPPHPPAEGCPGVSVRSEE